jgi:hypothetical protein
MKNIPKSHTITSLAGRIGVPVSLIRQAKKAGADGFSANGNVDADKLLAWLLSKGKDFQPKSSLEDARSRLADMKARVLEREHLVSQGDVLPVLWIWVQIESRFRDTLSWLEDRLPHLAYLVSTAARTPDLDAGNSEVLHLLRADCKTLRIGFNHIRDAIRLDLKKGTDEQSDLGTVLKKFEEIMTSIANEIPEDVRRLIHNRLTAMETNP